MSDISFPGAARSTVRFPSENASSFADDHINLFGSGYAGLGNAPRTIGCRGPSQRNVDVAIRKSVNITEKNKISLRVEVLNATDTPKFRAAEGRVGRSNFRRVSSQSGFARIIQWMVRYEF